MNTNQGAALADHKDIPLRKPLTVAGAPLQTLRMREPTVADQLAAQKSASTEEDREMALMANLCGLAPTDLHALSLRDYKAVQAAFLGFLD